MKHAGCASCPGETLRSLSTGTHTQASLDLSRTAATAAPSYLTGFPHIEHVASNVHELALTARVLVILRGVTPPSSNWPCPNARYKAGRPWTETKHLGCETCPASGHLSARTDSHTLIVRTRPLRVRTAGPLPCIARPHTEQIAVTRHDDADILTFCLGSKSHPLDLANERAGRR
jgi:hypothetical protein